LRSEKMAVNKWTCEQWEAITEKDANILVAAAAGAGKTAVLVQRIIEKITDRHHPVDIDRLLVMTFTNAAATQMRERIADAISARLERNPDSANIRRQLALLGKASISTIHSFCLNVVRNNFQLIDIDPGFRVADETEIQLMKLEVLEMLFEKQYEQENEGFLDLLECYGGSRDDRVLQQMVLSLYEFVQSCPWPRQWLEEMTEKMDIAAGTDFAQTTWGSVLMAVAQLELKAFKEIMHRAKAVLEKASGLEQYMDVYSKDMRNIDGMLQIMADEDSVRWDRVFTALNEISFDRLPPTGKDVEKLKKETVMRYRDNVKQGIKRLKERVITASSEEIIKDIKSAQPP
jgi:ATP-dependent helicase/nuclease subunit A